MVVHVPKNSMINVDIVAVHHNCKSVPISHHIVLMLSMKPNIGKILMNMTSSVLLEIGTETRSFHLVEALEAALDDGLYSLNSPRTILTTDPSHVSSALGSKL